MRASYGETRFQWDFFHWALLPTLSATLNYDIKLPADIDAKQFRGIKVPYKFTNSVPVRKTREMRGFPGMPRCVYSQC